MLLFPPVRPQEPHSWIHDQCLLAEVIWCFEFSPTVHEPWWSVSDGSTQLGWNLAPELMDHLSRLLTKTALMDLPGCRYSRIWGLTYCQSKAYQPTILLALVLTSFHISIMACECHVASLQITTWTQGSEPVSYTVVMPILVVMQCHGNRYHCSGYHMKHMQDNPATLPCQPYMVIYGYKAISCIYTHNFFRSTFHQLDIVAI